MFTDDPDLLILFFESNYKKKEEEKNVKVENHQGHFVVPSDYKSWLEYWEEKE